MKKDTKEKVCVQRRQKKNGNPLPKILIGAVCKQYVRRGEKVYGPYWCRFWREDGKLRKEYVPREEVEAVQEACARIREGRVLLAEIRRTMRNWKSDWSNGLDVIREVEASGKAK